MKISREREEYDKKMLRTFILWMVGYVGVVALIALAGHYFL